MARSTAQASCPSLYSIKLQEVEKYHEEGNEAFRNKLYRNAKVKYYSALELLLVISKPVSFDSLIMFKVEDKEKKLLCNLSKAHRHLGQFMEAMKQANVCVTKYPNHAKGHYCLAEALRDSLPSDPACIGGKEAQVTRKNALRHFAVVFRSMEDKRQAFLQCALLAIPADLTDLLPALPEMEKKSILQHTLEAILKTQQTSDLKTYLQFFFVQGDNIAQLPCRPGCAIGLVSFQHCHVLADVYPFLQQHLVEVLVRHEMPVDVNVIVKMLRNCHSRQIELIKVMFPALPGNLMESLYMREVLEVAFHEGHFDVLLYLCQQGVHFHPDIVALVMKQQRKSSNLAELKSQITSLSVGNLVKAVKLRDEGTEAYKREDFVTARKSYWRALVILDHISTTESKVPHSKEMQKVLGNLSSVDRNLKNYHGSVSWAKSLIDTFPDNPKGYLRRAKAYRDNAVASKGDEKRQLRISAVEDFAKVFKMCQEPQAYIECVFLAVLADAVHLIPVIRLTEATRLGRATLDYLLTSTKQEDVAKFINNAVALSPGKKSQIAFPFYTDLKVAESVSLIDSPSLRLSLQCMKHLMDTGVKVTYAGHAEVLKSVLDTVHDGVHDAKLINNSLGEMPLHEVAKRKNKPTDEAIQLLLAARISLPAESKNKSNKTNFVKPTFAANTAQKGDSKESKLALDQGQAQVKSSEAVRQDTLTVLVKKILQLVGKHDFQKPVAPPSKPHKDDYVEEESGSEQDQDSEEDDEVESVQKSCSLDNAVMNSQRDQNLLVPSEQRFDGLTWEVDCTERFRKSLSHLQKNLRENIITKIRKLATGEWQTNFHKPVGRTEMKLFEMKTTKGQRVLWQKTIDHSHRCSKADSKQVLYSDIIRLWDLVEHKGIKPCIKYVEKSFSKSRYSHVKHNLQRYSPPDDQSNKSPSKSRSMTDNAVPKLYVCSNDKQDTGPQYTPAAAPGQLDYSVIPFYVFSTAMVRNLLYRAGKRYDFPLKGCPKEHDIIKLKPEEPILLLGRSGTGKTTCCVYRLWNQCNDYWSQAVKSRMPRVPLLFTGSTQQGNEGTTDDSEKLPVKQQGLKNLSSVGPGTVSSSTSNDTVKCVDPDIVEQDDLANAISSSANVDEELTVEPVTNDSTAFDHLQQIFITKNPVLVSQVHKKFYDLASGSPHMSDHLKFENTTLPSRFHEVPPLAYPLFVTSFQWLNMVDASLTAGSSMFPRDDKGKLQVELVDSGGEFSATTDDLELFDESESESEDVDEDSTNPHATAEHATSVKRQRVVDSSYFCHFVWRQITRRTEVNLRKKYDPLLVWMEIRSFLKGSYECLMIEDGKMTLQQYKNIGAKRAENFTGDRDEVFFLFELYQKYLIQHDLVDQCDWVHSIFWRLKQQKEVDIVIHEFYIDEVQDFTQAELYLILHCCRCPNVGLFLTGDTAQSIMKGIAFRFKDLRSLFYHFNDDYLKEDKAQKILKIPKINQLTQNFRSHSGILEVASTVIQVLQDFFPFSFDFLPKDQGLFPGPLPIVLHSISESDLAIILRGNRRESVTIEFGAHQAVIVQTEEAKQSLPVELSQAIVLTVFEAKGLEFDDVLLYNFFADSKADQEWRLVLKHLSNSGTEVSADEFPFLDKNVLRPLEFDKKRHRSFSAELKYLYTAITRAKCNLWIYDTNPARFSPLVYVLLKLKLVSAVSLNDISQEDVTTVFVKESSSDEWLDRGRYFLKKKLWEPAQTCFHKGGNDVLAMEAEARSLISKAKSTDKGRAKARHELFQSAAILFLQCASSSDSLDLTYLKYAAAYLHLGQQWEQAGQVFESISEWTKAFKSYHKAKNFSKASAMKEKLGQYNESLLYLRNAGMYPLALKTALKYRKDNVFIEGSSISVEDLAYQTAKYHKSRQEYDNMYECVRLLPGIDDQIRLLKSAGEYDQVVKLCVSENMVEEAYEILAARGRFVEGRQLALSRNNGVAALRFLLMEARSLEVVRLSVSDICSGLYLQLSEEERTDRLSDLRGTLYDLIGRMTTVIVKWHLVHKYPTLVLEKILLEAVCHYDVGKLQLRGKKMHNVFAQMERVRLLVNLTPLEASLDRIPVKELHLSSQQLLEKLPTLVTLRDNPADLSQESTELLSQVEEWYGLRCDPPQYSVLPQQDLWLRFSRQAGKISFAVNLILDHLYASVKKWLGISRKIINSILESDKFAGYKEVATCNNLAQAQKLEPRVLKEYIELLCLAVKVEITDRDALLMDVAFNIKDRDAALIAAFEKLSEDEVKITMKKCSAKSKSHLRPTILKQCSGKQGFEYLRNLFPRLLTDLGQSSCRTLVKYFSPVVACHAPLLGMHYRALCASSAVHECVLSYGNLSTRALTDINAFMTVWWMRGGDRLRDMLNKCEHKGALSDFFIFDRQLKREIHYFMIWIWACSKQQEPMTFCKTAIYRFTRYIAKRKGVKKLNPANMLPLLELLSTTLIGMLVSLEDCIRGHRTGFMACLPKRYEHVVQLFGDASWTTNTRRGDNHLLDKVYTSMAEGGNPQGLLGEARSLLVELADIFFGLSAYRGFKVLEYVLDGEDNISNGLLQRAFELSAVLLANLEFFAGRECLKYRMEFLDVIRSSSQKRFARHQSADLQQGEAAYSMMCGHVYSSVEKASSTLDLVSFMSSLCGGRGVSMLRVDQQKWTVYFAPLQSLESYKPVLFHGVPAMLPTPPSPSKGSTPWPEWSEGEAFYPTQPKVPQESSFERESSVDAYEEEGFDGEDGEEQDSFFLDTTQVDRSEQVERYFEQDDCLACGITMKETCEDSDVDPKIQHIDGALHISNAAAFNQFKEMTSESTVLKGAMTALQQSKAVQDRNLDLDRAEDLLKQSVDRLKKTQGALPEGVRDAAAWRRHCQEFEAASNTVAKFLADSLKCLLNTHVKSLKDSQSLISLQTDDENDDDVLPDDFEQTVEDQPVKKKKSRYRRKTRNR